MKIFACGLPRLVHMSLALLSIKQAVYGENTALKPVLLGHYHM